MDETMVNAKNISLTGKKSVIGHRKGQEKKREEKRREEEGEECGRVFEPLTA